MPASPMTPLMFRFSYQFQTVAGDLNGTIVQRAGNSDLKPATVPIKNRPDSGTEHYRLGQQLWHQMDHDKRPRDYARQSLRRLSNREGGGCAAIVGKTSLPRAKSRDYIL